MTTPTVCQPSVPRLKVMMIAVYLGLSFVLARLFYWQIIKGTTLQAKAIDQYQRTETFLGQRGRILTADGYTLVGNQPAFRLFATPQTLQDRPDQIAAQIVPLLLVDLKEFKTATEAAVQQQIQSDFTQKITTKLASTDSKWVSLMTGLSAATRQKIADLAIHGLGFDRYDIRYYPEASLSAHVTGFVGKNEQGEEVGYFGVEGALDKELKPYLRKDIVQKDALGLNLFGDHTLPPTTPNGRDVVLTIRRDIQYLVEQQLRDGMERYGAKSGEVIIMEPATGKILASAAFPSYSQGTFYEYPAEVYKHPSFSAFYEPGSTFKTLTVAAGIDAGVITPDTQCTECDHARQIGKYTIKTWNDQYHPNITMTEALAKSDNTAMMFIVDKLGGDQFVEYLKKFGLTEKTYTEVQEDSVGPFPSKWGPVELATASFGQGISATSMQMVKAIATIANHGVMMRPQIVEKVINPVTTEEIAVQPIIERTVIKPETALQVSQMMVAAAEAGEAQWTASKTHRIAAKTGTSQVAVNGAYDPDKTIATFVGFTPPEKPTFIMMVKLVEPQSSPWAAETAAPLWYKIADKLYLLLNIPPDK